MAQEFHLSITPLEKDEYLIRTEQVAMGVPLAEELVILPIEEWLVQTQLNPVDLGQQLYNTVFSGTIRDSWATAQGIAQYKKQILRLRLGIRGRIAPQLSWESLSNGMNAIAVSDKILLSRYISPAKAIPGDDVYRNNQLNILLVLSAYSVKESLDLKKEVIELQGEASKYPIQLTILDQANRKDLVSALEQGNFQVFHYAGYPESSAFNSGITLVDSESGSVQKISGGELSRLLANNGIQMAIICPHLRIQNEFPKQFDSQSGYSPDEFIADIPVVLYMKEPIPCDTAITFNKLFYRNLKRNQPIDLIVSRVRSGLMLSYGADRKYWTLPLLYLNPEFNGFIVNVSNTVEDLIEKGLSEPSSPSRSEAAETVSILLIAADPTNASRLRIGEEFREIHEKLQLAKFREKFRIDQRTSIRPTDLSQVLLDLHPQILHFSGHGVENGALYFEDQIGQIHPIPPDALAALFEQFKDQVKCILLNACYSEIQAIALSEHIDYVIGMSKAIGDKAAIAFAVGFYQALGAGRTIEAAHKLGCVQVRLQGIPEDLSPVLVKSGKVKT